MQDEGALPDPSNGDEPASPARLPVGPDFLIAVGFLLFAGVVYWITTTFDTVPRALVRGIQPAAYPRFLVGIIVILSVLLMISAWRHRDRDTRKAAPPILTLYTALMLLAIVVLLPILGLVPVLVMFCAVVPVLWGQRNPVVIVGYAVVFPMLVYGLFGGLLGVRFPAGLLSGLM